MDDEQLQLVSAAQQGDKEAFAALVRAYKDFVYRIAVGILQSHTEAEDVAQEVFVKVYLKLPRLREARSFPSWLATVTTRRALDVSTKQRRLRVLPIDEQVLSTQINEIERADRRLLIQRLLSQLNPIHRAVLILRELQGYDYDEMARVLQVPVGTVRSRLNHARIQLRRLFLSEEEVDPHSSYRE